MFKTSFQKSTARICVLLLLAAVAFIAHIRHLERNNIFYPAREIYQTPLDIAFEDVFFKTKDNVVLNGWILPAGKNDPVFIYLHGNGGNISTRVEKLRIFHDLGLNVFIIDYRGYGKSEGRPSERGIYEDAKAAYDYISTRMEFAENKIIAYGESLGGAAATDLAVERMVDALIIDSSFTSARDMAHVIYPYIPGFLVHVKLNSADKIKKIMIPKLMIHSREDDIVPYHLGKKLFDAAAEPKVFVEIKGSHNQGFKTSKDVYIKGIKGFLRQLEAK